MENTPSSLVGAAPALAVAEPETDAATDNILRWEDDGGTAIQMGNIRIRRSDSGGPGSAQPAHAGGEDT